MLYKTEDSFSNYKNVKREVPERDTFLKMIVDNVYNYCDTIEIAEPNTELAKILNETKCKIVDDNLKINSKTKQKRVISFPNEKTLLYGIMKASIDDVKEDLPTEEKAIITCIEIGKCISVSEVIRDFNGWSWSILPNEIESTECNIIYNLLVYLYGKDLINVINSNNIAILKKNMTEGLWNELAKVAIQFYMSYDKNQNEHILKKLAEYKTKLSKMKDQAKYVIEIGEEKKRLLEQIRNIDEIMNNPVILKQQYLNYNSKLPNEQKIFSVSHYADLLEKERNSILSKIDEYNKMQNPNEFIKARDELMYQIKLYECKTDISKLQTEFLRCYEKKIEKAEDRKEILDIIYEIRYLNYIPNCKMRLIDLQRKIIPKAIEGRVLNPISNNDDLDIRLLSGIFESQAVNLEGLYIKLSNSEDGIWVQIYDGDTLEKEYNVQLPDGSNVEIKRKKKTKIFE